MPDVTVHYIDIRAVGKGYDEFFEQAKAMGATFVKGRVAGITETAEKNLVLRYEDIDNGGVIAEAEYALVVLAVGVLPNRDASRLFKVEELALDDQEYVDEVDEDAPTRPGRAFPECSSPVPRPVRRTSRSRSFTLVPPSRRRPPTSTAGR